MRNLGRSLWQTPPQQVMKALLSVQSGKVNSGELNLSISEKQRVEFLLKPAVVLRSIGMSNLLFKPSPTADQSHSVFECSNVNKYTTYALSRGCLQGL